MLGSKSFFPPRSKDSAQEIPLVNMAYYINNNNNHHDTRLTCDCCCIITKVH